jgi:hypothetical protein
MIVQLMGGLGNQLFQYAFGRSVSLARNLPLFFNKGKTKDDTHIQYMMDTYDLDLKFDNRRDEIYFESGMPFDPSALVASPTALYFGNWQSEKYFNEPVIRKELSIPKGYPSEKNLHWAEWAQSRDSAFIQVRRGDYLNPTTKEYHGCQSLDYYLAGAELIKDKRPLTQFLVFSDDPAWCEANFPSDFTVVKENIWQDRTAQWDLWIMSHCTAGGVMANSSFGWWAAWLGDEQKDRVVVAPKKWFDQAKVDERDIIPERWVRI